MDRAPRTRRAAAAGGTAVQQQVDAAASGGTAAKGRPGTQRQALHVLRDSGLGRRTLQFVRCQRTQASAPGAVGRAHDGSVARQFAKGTALQLQKKKKTGVLTPWFSCRKCADENVRLLRAQRAAETRTDELLRRACRSASGRRLPRGGGAWWGAAAGADVAGARLRDGQWVAFITELAMARTYGALEREPPLLWVLDGCLTWSDVQSLRLVDRATRQAVAPYFKVKVLCSNFRSFCVGLSGAGDDEAMEEEEEEEVPDVQELEAGGRARRERRAETQRARRRIKKRQDELEKKIKQLEQSGAALDAIFREQSKELSFTKRRLRTVERREGVLGDSTDSSTQTDTRFRLKSGRGNAFNANIRDAIAYSIVQGCVTLFSYCV
eukprot:SAG25_NODE_655_length_6126_cov_12.125270_11_plen_381_part_00